MDAADCTLLAGNVRVTRNSEFTPRRQADQSPLGRYLAAADHRPDHGAGWSDDLQRGRALRQANWSIEAKRLVGEYVPERGDLIVLESGIAQRLDHVPLPIRNIRVDEIAV